MLSHVIKKAKDYNRVKYAKDNYIIQQHSQVIKGYIVNSQLFSFVAMCYMMKGSNMHKNQNGLFANNPRLNSMNCCRLGDLIPSQK